MTWKSEKSKGSKSLLIQALHEVGLSFRNSERGVNALFDIIAQALHRGEIVETPVGELHCRTVQRKRRYRFMDLINAQTGERMYKMVRYKAGPVRRFTFRPNPELQFPVLSPLPLFASPPTSLPVAAPRRAITLPRTIGRGTQPSPYGPSTMGDTLCPDSFFATRIRR